MKKIYLDRQNNLAHNGNAEQRKAKKLGNGAKQFALHEDENCTVPAVASIVLGSADSRAGMYNNYSELDGDNETTRTGRNLIGRSRSPVVVGT